jgi:hypothetical protein
VTSDELIDQLTSADGEICIADPSERVRSQYRRAIYDTKERGLVPEGLQLWHTGRDRGDMVIRLLKRHAPPPRTATPPQASPPAPEPQRVPITKQKVQPRRCVKSIQNKAETLGLPLADPPRDSAVVVTGEQSARAVAECSLRGLRGLADR